MCSALCIRVYLVEVPRLELGATILQGSCGCPALPPDTLELFAPLWTVALSPYVVFPHITPKFDWHLVGSPGLEPGPRSLRGWTLAR